MEHTNGLRASRVSIKDFFAYLSQGPSSLHHIQVDKILVVDHLGRNIPVPTIFCSTWRVGISRPHIHHSSHFSCQEFSHIIKGYCKHSHGNRHLKRGDYEVIRPGDGQVISRSDFASTVKPGMILELSIILRRDFQDNKECPRCYHINRFANISGGWIEWQMSPNSFINWLLI
jgi:hypothetical protein